MCYLLELKSERNFITAGVPLGSIYMNVLILKVKIMDNFH